MKIKIKSLIDKINNIYTKNKKYLPSKQFSTVLGVLVLLVVIVFSVSFLYKSIKSRISTNKDTKEELKIEDQTIPELLRKDSDNDGVYDWEETLWSTNKHKPATFNNVPDLEYIEKKKKELNVVEEADDKTLTETDKFAREFFSTYAAIHGTGEVDDQTIMDLSISLGQKVTNPILVDKYTEGDVKVMAADNPDRQAAYYTTIADLFAKYEAKGIGDELEIITNALEGYENKDTSSSFNKLGSISQAYKDFANGVMNTPVPESLAEYHLDIANAAYNVGISVANMAKAISDPLVGVSGVSEYEKYSNEFTDAVEAMEASFDE